MKAEMRAGFSYMDRHPTTRSVSPPCPRLASGIPKSERLSMSLCKCGCGRTVPPSRGYHPRIWFEDSCRKRAARRVAVIEKEVPRDAPSVDLDELLVPGDVGVVD